MPKVIQINPGVISVGMDDGSIIDFSRDQFNFTPVIGDELQIYQNSEKVIITRVGPQKSQHYHEEQNNYYQAQYSQPQYSQPQYQQYFPQQYNNNNQQVVVNNNIAFGKPKDKWVAFILCFLFGVIGVHKFYEGKIGMGILYIFTVGLCGIGVIVDLICILLKPNPYYV